MGLDVRDGGAHIAHSGQFPQPLARSHVKSSTFRWPHQVLQPWLLLPPTRAEGRGRGLATLSCQEQEWACFAFPAKVSNCSSIHSPDPSRPSNRELMYNLHPEL